MPTWVQTGYREYTKRLPKELAPHLVEIPVAHRSKNSQVRAAVRQESQAILQALTHRPRRIMLDLRGKHWSTKALSERLSEWMMDGQDIAFVIGGPDGFDEECFAQADEIWCLSNLTLPHPLVRILFAEQLYRAWSILQNHPYHK